MLTLNKVKDNIVCNNTNIRKIKGWIFQTLLQFMVFKLGFIVKKNPK